MAETSPNWDAWRTALNAECVKFPLRANLAVVSQAEATSKGEKLSLV